MRRATTILVATALACVASPAAAAGVEKGDEPSLRVTTVDGAELELRDWRGKVVLVDFWATWCAPCQVSLPFYERLAEKYDDENFRVLAVSVDEQRQAVSAFLEEHDFSFAVAVDSDHDLVERFAPKAMPTLFVLGPEGTVRTVHEGFEASDKSALAEEIDELVDEARDSGGDDED